MNDLKDIFLEFGAYAGAAAFIGLSVLALLYFSQARDVRRLREWAGRAPERDAEVRLFAEQLTAQALAAAFESMAPSPVRPESGGEPIHISVDPVTGDPVVQAIAGAHEPAATDAGESVTTGAGAVAEATSEYDVLAHQDEPVSDVDEVAPGVSVPADETDGESVGTSAAQYGDAGDLAATAGPTADRAAEDPESVAPSGATGETGLIGVGASGASGEAGSVGAAAATEGEPATPDTSPPEPKRLAPTTPAAIYSTTLRGGGATADRPSLAARAPFPLPPLDTGSFEFGALPDGDPARDDFALGSKESGPRRPLMIALAGLAAAAMIVFASVQLLAENDGKPASRAETTPEPRGQVPGANPRINRPAVTVGVLNGTKIDGLAAVVGEQVQRAKFTLGKVANAVDSQEHVESVVYYAAGSKLEGREVARELGIKPLKQLDARTQAADSAAQVIVVVGADIEQ